MAGDRLGSARPPMSPAPVDHTPLCIGFPYRRVQKQSPPFMNDTYFVRTQPRNAFAPPLAPDSPSLVAPDAAPAPAQHRVQLAQQIGGQHSPRGFLAEGLGAAGRGEGQSRGLRASGRGAGRRPSGGLRGPEEVLLIGPGGRGGGPVGGRGLLGDPRVDVGQGNPLVCQLWANGTGKDVKVKGDATLHAPIHSSFIVTKSGGLGDVKV
ncbi:hypothetical protein EYF80_026559 [Liparis tanakae]|uniref:Uncharacterized protein n=1 Tax=Liparis tanakae TaxID=230148 RepID=A0A4Z2HBT1_9TELE|nr:hypothetical protein EYF80_026559 [Liparis tanakae]